MNAALLILTAFFGAVGFLVVMLAHEFGHAWAYYRIKKRWLKLHVRWNGLTLGKDKDYAKLTDDEFKAVILTGIFTGGLQILIFYLLVHPVLFVYLAPYALGVRSDLRQLARLPK